MLVVGLIVTAQLLGLQAWGLQAHPDSWQTQVFTGMVFTQIALVLAIRSERLDLSQLGLTSNMQLLAAVVLTVGLQLCLIYIPALNRIFKTTALSLFELLLCFAIAGLTLALVETGKWARRKGWLYPPATVK